ncbi:MAG: nuclear transport factor 2 family protein [Pseudomonadota bacterium]
MSLSDENKTLVRTAFASWEDGNSGPFFDLIADDVTWRVIGTTPASGIFTSKQALLDHAFAPLLARLDGPLTVKFIHIAGEGDKVFLQFQSHGLAKNGTLYDQDYCFAMTLRAGRVVHLVAYLDTALLGRVFA